MDVIFFYWTGWWHCTSSSS